MLCNTGLVNMSLYGITNEGDNIKFLETLPISNFKIIISKIMTNIIMGIPLIIFQFGMVRYVLEISLAHSLITIILSFIMLLLMSIMGIVIDLKFYGFNDNDMKLPNMIPSFIIIFILVTSFVLFNSPYLYKDIYLFTYGLILMILILFLIVCLLLFSKKWLKRIMN